MLTREITRFFIRSKWKNSELFPFLEKNLIMKRETTPDNFFNILFISAFLGGMGVYQYNFLHWFYHVYFIFGMCYFVNHWIPKRDFSCVSFFFSFSLIIIIPYKLPNFFSVNSDYIYLIPSITKPEKPSGTVTRKS